MSAKLDMLISNLRKFITDHDGMDLKTGSQVIDALEIVASQRDLAAQHWLQGDRQVWEKYIATKDDEVQCVIDNH